MLTLSPCAHAWLGSQELGIGEVRHEDVFWRHVLPRLQGPAALAAPAEQLAALLLYPLRAGLLAPDAVGVGGGGASVPASQVRSYVRSRFTPLPQAA